MYRFKNDEYKSSRGKWSRILKATCCVCSNHVFFYQKDGSGPLKRSYFDRFIDIKPTSNKEFRCQHCDELLGVSQPYKKENDRPAVRWLVGALEYVIVPVSKLKKVPDIFV